MIKLLYESPKDRAKRYLEMLTKSFNNVNLDTFGMMGVKALQSATPIDSGETAASWAYRIDHKHGHDEIIWYNTKHNDGESIAVLIQYGHATATGGYVHPIDYINPALQPVYEQLEKYIEGRVKDV